MSRLKALMFNRKASSLKSKPDKVLKALSIQPGQHVADIGVGGGYFTIRFAEAVREDGVVYGVDTRQEFLDILKRDADKKRLTNIKPVPAQHLKSSIPEQSLDHVFLRNVYHHLKNRIQYFREISPLLKPDGRIAVIEYNGAGGLSFHKLFGHYVPQKEIIEEMKEAGYIKDKQFDFLDEQSFTVFSQKKI
jgi:arsenite methyltransferase